LDLECMGDVVPSEAILETESLDSKFWETLAIAITEEDIYDLL